jgi:hypothetical protein
MTETDQCVRCGYAGPSWDFSYWVLVCDDAGDRLAGVCGRCLTATEQREIDREAVAPLDDEFGWIDVETPAARSGADPPATETGQWVLRDLRRLPATSENADRLRRADGR